MTAILSIVGSVLLSLGGGALIVLALSNFLGQLWATRFAEAEKASQSREHELLVRRRNVYAKLAKNLRVFLYAEEKPTTEQKEEFLAVYDEAALWASEEVVAAVGVLLDINMRNATSSKSVSMDAYRAAYVHCITSMRRDSGFPETEYLHRPVVFKDAAIPTRGQELSP